MTDRRSLLILAALAVLAALALWLLRRAARAAATEGMAINSQDNTEKYPYCVQFVRARDGESFCGGVLIEPDVVLTAAHCLWAKVLIDDIYCTIGDDLPGGPKISKPSYRYIKKIVNNPRFKINGNYGDISLVFLERPVYGRATCNLISGEELRSAIAAKWRMLMVGRGLTNRDVEAYVRGRFRDARTVDQDFNPRPTMKLVVPRDLQVVKFDNLRDTIKFEHDEIIILQKGSSLFNGDSGGPLFVRVGQEWKIAGVTSSGDNKDDFLFNKYMDDPNKRWSSVFISIPYWEKWIRQTIASERVSIVAPDMGITVHEIAHVVALTRLKHLKKMAMDKTKTFEELFLPGSGDAKKRWLDLAEYIEGEEGARRYDGMGKATEAQLAVLWALVSSADNYKVLLEMVTNENSDEHSSVPYLLRLGYKSGVVRMRSLDDRQKFDKSRVGGSIEWSMRSGDPPLWTKEKTEIDGEEIVAEEPGATTVSYYKATTTEKEVHEAEQLGLRPSRSDTPLSVFLESRPLRRRMFCDFSETLREYMKTRRSWYRKYFQFNNIDSPARTDGLYQCYSKNKTDYLDATGTPKTSYGPNAAACFDARGPGLSSPAVDTFAWVKTTGIKSTSRDWIEDPSRAWLQSSGDSAGDHWPELTATTLYDRYEWIQMPDSKRKITFREAMFLVLDGERVDISGNRGVTANKYSYPVTLDDGTLNDHPGARNIQQFYPSFLRYFFKMANSQTAWTGWILFVVLERMMHAYVTSTSDKTYEMNEPVYYTLDKGTAKQTRVRGKIGSGARIVPKNERKVNVRYICKDCVRDSLLTGTFDMVFETPKSLEDAWNFAIQFSSGVVIPERESWALYDFLPSDGGPRVEADARQLEPAGVDANARYTDSEQLDECKAKSKKKDKKQPQAPPPPSDTAEKLLVNQNEQARQLLSVFPCLPP